MDMLVLSRYPHQVVLIGDDIQVTVLDISNDRVRLGIVAPREVLVRRQELRAESAAPQTQ
jgi:carbon storage regulator